MKAVAIASALLVATATIAGDTVSIQIVEFGMYAGTHRGAVADSTAPTSHLLLGGPVKCVAQTNIISGAVGGKFGFAFVVKGPPEGTSVALTMVYTFPEMVDPNTQRRMTQYKVNGSAKAGDHTPRMLWDFTEPWEVVSGEWLFQIYGQGRKLAEKAFTVVRKE